MMFCTFWLAESQYAVPMLDVQEVIQQQVLTPVPLAPPLLRGLMNLRGTLVVSIDMRRRLQLPPASDDLESIQVIVDGGGSLFGLMVDQMGDVIELDPASAQLPPGSTHTGMRQLIREVYPLAEGLLSVLDVKQILEIDLGQFEATRETALTSA